MTQASQPVTSPMKRALLVGVPDLGKADGLRPAPSLAAMTALLEDLGGWQITTLAEGSTGREHVLAALDAMLAACGPHDTCLFYFFGHGGVVRFTPLPGPLGARPVFYLATLRPPGTPMIGVLDVELSDALTRLDQICGNVTAILDCCHSASIMRGGVIPEIAPPPWLTARAPQERQQPRVLAVESHPRIVRLFGASSLRHAYPEHRPDGHCGLLTKYFVEVLREAELRCHRLTWDAVAHRVREQASLARGMEDQRIVLAGPRQRLVFSSQTIAPPSSAAYMPSGEPGWGWIRAGVLQGIERGDRWAITSLALGDDLEPQVLTEAEVQEVELDRCTVTLSVPWSHLRPGASALLLGFDRLEARAKADRLLSSLVANDATATRDGTLRWRWGRLGAQQRPHALGSSSDEHQEIPRLHIDDRIWIELNHRGYPPPHWFVSVVLLDADGRLVVLNTREPEGMEVAPGVSARLGLRGGSEQQGLPVSWPLGVPPQRPCRSTLLVLASRRPIALGHLVHLPEPDDDALLAQGLGPSVRTPRPGSRTRGPVTSSGWTWDRIDFELDPRPRPRAAHD